MPVVRVAVRSVRPAPHKDFLDFYEKMTGREESASGTHRPRAPWLLQSTNRALASASDSPAATIPKAYKDLSDFYGEMTEEATSVCMTHRP